MFRDRLQHLRQTCWLPEHRPLTLTCAAAVVWMLFWFDALAWFQLPEWLHGVGFTAALGGVAYWLWRTWDGPTIRWRFTLTLCFLPVWQWLVWIAHHFGFMSARGFFARAGLVSIFAVGLGWAVWYVELKSRGYRKERFAAGVTAQTQQVSPREFKWAHVIRSIMTAPVVRHVVATGPGNICNPLDEEALYYGERARKLNQSLATIVTYSIAFALLVWILLRATGCQEIYEMPSGGGEQKQLQQVVTIKKVIRKKFVINPFSAVKFNPPPIEEIKVINDQMTKHAYTVGYGKGKGAGFSGGTNRGLVRFIRIEYAGGDWDQDFGVGADLNMLLEYGVRTGHKVAAQTESRTVAQLKNFPKGKSPPMVYMTGQRSISMSKNEIETLREYMLDKHGMIFADNGGSSGWHSQFFNMMRQVLPKVEPVKVPLDDPIHRVPYAIPFLPYVAPHGGKDAYGWKVDGRWVAYYHPGDIGDAWSDGHAGVKREIWEACFQLGTNVIFYAHIEFSKWLDSQKPQDGAKESEE